MSSPAERARRLLEAYDACVALDGAAQAAQLAAIAREDPALAQRVRAMLGFEPASGTLGVESVVGEMHADASGSTTGEAPPPARIGGFTLLRLLGRGGMGEVWLAEREHDGFRQQVALKRLRSGRDGEDLRRRFVQERRILAGLSHPGIARFVDGGVGEDGAPWYAMEYVQGVPIVEHARAAGLDARALVALVADVAEAVAYAQARLVVHRDLKPSNILIDGEGRPRLLDFGIAKLLESDLAANETASGLRAMSPAYAAPEQILGEPVGTATDVYALGVVLYELLTGALPHARDAVTLETLAERVRHETIERPSARLRAAAKGGRATADTQRALRALSGELDAIVLTALRREPERRYASAAALADDLRRWLDGRPVRAQPDTAGYRLRKFVARNRLAVGSAVAVLLALVAGLGTTLWQADVARGQAALARSEAARAQAQAEIARRAQAEAEAINGFFAQRLSEARANEQAQGAALTVKDWVLAAVPRLDAELADAPAARATLRRELGSALNSLGDAAGSREVLRSAVRESREAYGETESTALALHALAIAEFALGAHADARGHSEEAIALLDRLPDDDRVRGARIQARTTLLRVHSLAGDHAAALALAQRNLEDRAALYGADDPRLAVDYNNLSGTYNQLSRLTEAEAAARRTLELLESNPARPVARIAFVQQGLCSLAAQRAAYARALEACARAAALYTEALGSDSIELASVGVTEARVRFAAGEAEAARALLDAVEPRLAAAGRAVEMREIRLTRMRLALRDGDWKTLEEVGRRLLDALPQPPAGRVSSERNVALALTALGRYMRGRDPAAAAQARGAAEALLARDDVVAYFRASAALGAALAMDAGGDPAASRALRERAIDALALNMPRAEAVALWARWQPVSAPSR